jgi:cellobiose phosphorylase
MSPHTQQAKASLFYSFERNDTSFAIRDPEGPRRPWQNYLFNEEGWLCSVSHVGLGESRYLTDKLELCQVTGGAGKLFYLRDEESGACWCPTYGPLAEPLDAFRCEHGLSFSSFSAEKDGIRSEVRVVVPQKGLYEVWRVSITNTSEHRRTLSLFALVQFDLFGYKTPRYYGPNLEMYHLEDVRGIYAESNNPYMPHPRYNALFASSEAPFAYECFLGEFFGGGGSSARPALLLKKRDLQNKLNTSAQDGAILQHKIVLAPGETRTLRFCLAIAADRDEARSVAKSALAEGRLEALERECDSHWQRIIGHCALRTPDARINRVMNTWAKKQMIFCRVGKKGVRDNMQIADGVLQIWPDGGRAEILDVLAHQFKDGHTVLTWFPYDDTYYSDQPIWLVMGVTGYIKETGDYSILDEQVPYQDGGSGTVWEHLLAGLRLKQEDLGPNGLCKLRFADWNDALNVHTDDEAESVFVSMGLGYMLREMAELARRRGDEEFAARCDRDHAALTQKLNEVAWNGDYYTMVYHRGGVIGDKTSEGSTIYINPQTWAILGDIVPPERLPELFRSMDERVEHDFGLPVNWPPYERYSPDVGRMGAFRPGVYENGGAYCHATGFGIVANAKAGRGDVALRLLDKILPDSALNPSTNSGAEPYVFTNCYFTHPKRYGWSTGSWMTGTSVWCFKGLVEWILGVRRGYDGLVIDPCLPPAWKQAEVTRSYRGATYHIKLENPDGVSRGKLELNVDGERLDGNVLPIFADGRTHEVVARVRKS